MSTTPTPRVFEIRVRTMPPLKGEPDADIRLKAVLKRLLRPHRFVCTSVLEIQDEPAKETTP